ncbi:DUF255 domain-containing protein [Candidatus Woesearchaeota archaeon]|nr:MAG: DUF255 domain-containing protein [Candidatus Woesearchaeota archaeon]
MPHNKIPLRNPENRPFLLLPVSAFFIFLLFAFSLVSAPVVSAGEKYSFENAEKLKPLIEWRDYGPEAFQEALKENKPIFLLLTAPTWCYWCQVYESEDYLFNDAVYPYINRHFIPIYVDADRRQDLTRKYLEGGWPSTTVMTPGRQRLFGFSGVRPVSIMLENLKKAVDYVNSTRASSSANSPSLTAELYRKEYDNKSYPIPDSAMLNRIIAGYKYHLLQVFDPAFGGFGTGQKFPQGRTLDYALEKYSRSGDERFLNVVLTTMRNQYTKTDEIETNYNLFDPVEGAFHRYGTRRDWTPPHYEKMLYDNARLLRAYFHLKVMADMDAVSLSSDDYAVLNDIVSKTLSYISKNWYDSSAGGFYGNTDVHGEDSYYGKNPRPEEKPRVEKTKYADWNGQAIVTYANLYRWSLNSTNTSRAELYRGVAEKSINFFLSEMLTEDGFYHYYANSTRAVRGTLADNAYMLLALVEGFDALENDEYLRAAEKTADYMLENLYDWRNHGFIERNSPDLELYAPGEHIDLRKPVEENGVSSYALLKLYLFTGKKEYLLAGLETLGYVVSNMVGLDRGYYAVRAAELVLNEDLLSEYASNANALSSIENEKTSSLWIDKLFMPEQGSQSESVTPDFRLKDENELNRPLLLLLVIAVAAGLLSFLSPCTLPLVPAYAAFFLRSERKNITGMTLSFLGGLALTFTAMGVSAALIGRVTSNNLEGFERIAGALLVAAGVYIISGGGFSGLRIKKKKPASYAGAFLLGSTMGVAWTPCAGPILVSILILASASETVLSGGLMLLAYSLGLGLPFLLFSGFASSAGRKSRLWKLLRGKTISIKIAGRKFSFHTTSVFAGALFIILGVLLFTGTLTSFNRFIPAGSLQRIIFSGEEKLLSLVR